MTEGAIIDWVGGLADDTWRAVAKHLGLHVFSLRSTCATLHRRVITIGDLPQTAFVAHRILRRLDAVHQLSGPHHAHPNTCYGRNWDFSGEVEDLWYSLRESSLRELTDMLDLLNTPLRLKASQRPCSALIRQLQEDDRLWAPIEGHMQRLKMLERNFGGYVYMDDDLADAMHRLRVYYGSTFLTGLFRDTSHHHWTTTWHLAAWRGNLPVLDYLYSYCIHFPNSTTPPGNHAIAHARRGLQHELDFFRRMQKPARSTAVEARYAEVIAFLKARSVPDHEWRDTLATIHTDPDSDSDGSEGSAMDMLDVALGAQLSAQ